MQDHKARPVRQRLLRAQHGGGLGGRAAPTNAPQPFPFDLGCWLLALHPVGETQPQDLFPQTRHNLGEKGDQISLTPSLLGPEEGAPRQGERALYSKHSLVWGLLSPLALALYDGAEIASPSSRAPGSGSQSGHSSPCVGPGPVCRWENPGEGPCTGPWK